MKFNPINFYRHYSEDFSFSRSEAESTCQIRKEQTTQERELKYLQCSKWLFEEGRFQAARTILYSLGSYSENPSIKKVASHLSYLYLNQLTAIEDINDAFFLGTLRYLNADEFNIYDIDHRFNHLPSSPTRTPGGTGRAK